MRNSYWRGMVKDAINCDDTYADILLEFQHQVSNGIDTSEASLEELKEYWGFIDTAYQEMAMKNYHKHINKLQTGENNGKSI